jgi:hypothetical protein
MVRLSASAEARLKFDFALVFRARHWAMFYLPRDLFSSGWSNSTIWSSASRQRMPVLWPSVHANFFSWSVIMIMLGNKDG